MTTPMTTKIAWGGVCSELNTADNIVKNVSHKSCESASVLNQIHASNT